MLIEDLLEALIRRSIIVAKSAARRQGLTGDDIEDAAIFATERLVIPLQRDQQALERYLGAPGLLMVALKRAVSNWRRDFAHEAFLQLIDPFNPELAQPAFELQLEGTLAYLQAVQSLGLSETESEILILRNEGHSFATIAATLGKQETTIKRTFRKITERVAEYLQDADEHVSNPENEKI